MRNSTRALVLLSGVPLTALLTAPAFADTVPSTAYDAGPGLTVSQTIGIFVGIPLLIIGVIYALVYGLTGRRGQRYPTGQPWSAPAEWFGETPPAHSEIGSGDAAPVAGPVDGEGGARGQW